MKEIFEEHKKKIIVGGIAVILAILGIIEKDEIIAIISNF